MESWQSMALLGLIVVLALAGALRWDALRVWIGSVFTPPSDAGAGPQAQRLQVPKHLNDAELRHQAPPSRPPVHRSGRRD